jgi:hypothetical protein
MNAPANISYEDRLKAAAKARRARLGFGRAIKSADEEKRPAASSDLFRPYQARFKAKICPRWMVEDIEFDEHVKAYNVFKAFKRLSVPRIITLQNRRTPKQIKLDVVEQFPGVTVEAMESRSRRAHISAARQVAMWIMRKELDLSYPQIARHFGGKNHTTIIHAVTKVQAYLDNNSGDIRKLSDYGMQFERAKVIEDILNKLHRDEICKKHGITRIQFQMIKQSVQKDIDR